MQVTPGATTSYRVLLLHSSLLVLIVAVVVVSVGAGGVRGGSGDGPSGNEPKEEVAGAETDNNGPTPSYRLFIKPMRRSSSLRPPRTSPNPPSATPTPSAYPRPHPRNPNDLIGISYNIPYRQDSTNRGRDSGINDIGGNDGRPDKARGRPGQRGRGGRQGPGGFRNRKPNFELKIDDSELEPEEQLPASNRSDVWNGRRSTGDDDYTIEEEEVLEGVSMDDPEALLPDPTGPAYSILEKRLQHSSIRHRKSRKNFVRTRKSPKMRSRSQAEDYERADSLESGTNEADEFEIIWENDSLQMEGGEGEEGGGLDGLEVRSTANSPPWYSSGAPNLENKFRATGDIPTEETEFAEEDDTTEESEAQGRADVDVVTKFLKIVESQHLMGENCTAGTDFNLGEGVADRYAQERFRLPGEIAVNRANLYTRLWKYSPAQVLQSQFLLHAEVLTMIELDEDIFAAGNCYDKYEYADYILFCPFAYRLPEGNILVKDLAMEYKYLSNSSEWFYRARKNAERAISNYTHLTKGYHKYTWNDTAYMDLEEEEILSVVYDDGFWSKPYFDCGGGNIWMMTYTVPFFGYANGTYYFKGTSGIDIDLRRVDIDQCPLPPGSTDLNIFANSDKCKRRTTQCITIPGLGFRRGSYKCECKDGFFFPDTTASRKYYNGSLIEEEYEKKMVGIVSLYDVAGHFECLPCAEGCETCQDDSPCQVTLNWVMRASILTLALIIILFLPVIVVFTWKYGDRKVVRAASPVLLRIILLGALFIYCTTLVLYPNPTVITCVLRVWLREIGFSLSYGALMLKTWRISVIFRVRSAKAVKITDLDLMKRLGVIVGVFAFMLAIRTVVAPPHVIISMTADDLKAYLCSTDWWDHVFTAMEMCFLVWGIRLCIVVRKAPSEFNESKFISMAIYNEFLLSLFLNVSMLFLQSPANPDLLFIIFFCHTQLTITLLIALIFGSKAYLVLRGQGKGEDSISLPKPSAAKFMARANAGNSQTMMTTNSGGGQVEGDVQEDFQKVYLQLERLKDRTQRGGNRVMVAKITAMQEAAKNCTAATATIVTAATAPQPPQPLQLPQPPHQPPVTTAVVSEKKESNVERQARREGSRKERKCSDGIIMKPYVNNILAKVSDNFACPPYKDDTAAPAANGGAMVGGEMGGGGGPTLLKKENNINNNNGKFDNRTHPLARPGSGEDLTLSTSKNEYDEGDEVSRTSISVPNDTSETISCHCRSVSHDNLHCGCDTKSDGGPDTPDCVSGIVLKPVGCRSVEFLGNTAPVVPVEFNERVCRSLENLDDTGGRGARGGGGKSGGDLDLALEDRSVRSAHSTPQRSQGRFREIRDPERARAYILYSLDRSTLTEEVTV